MPKSCRPAQDASVWREFRAARAGFNARWTGFYRSQRFPSPPAAGSWPRPGQKCRRNFIPQASSFRVETAKESPAVRGAFSREDRLAYLLIPEPGPVGVSVDPLGEEPAPMVLPDGFVVVVEPGAVERDAPEPVVVPAVPMPVPLTDEPVLAPPAAPPEAEPPAEPPPLCASAKVLVSARAVASAIVEIFMVASFLRCP